MNHYDQYNQRAKTSAFSQHESGFPGTPFPDDRVYDMPYPVPYQQPSKPSSGFGGFKLDEIKSAIDRMGGIDGILNMAQKMAKFMQAVQQMGPMFKLLLGSFGGSKAAATEAYAKSTRRKRKKRGQPVYYAKNRKRPKRRKYRR